MENIEFLDQIRALLAQEDLIGAGRDISALKTAFEDYILDQEHKDQVKRLEALEKGEEHEEVDFKPLREEFNALYKQVQEKRKQQLDLKNTLESENLKLKKSLITKLKEVIENEENISAAFNAQKEILETWKKIGDIPREKRDEVQREFSRLMELFYHNINIYREIKEYDYKRNQQLKEDVIFRLKTLRTSSSPIRDVEATLRALQDEWETIGPVHNDDWESLKAAYWEAVRSVYEKVNGFYDEQRNVLMANIEKKKALIVEISEVVKGLEELSKNKDWEAKTAQIIEIQNKWKQIGFGPRKENEAVWAEFRGICDRFFEAKKNFNKSIENVFKDNAAKKRELIEEVKKFEEATDWKATADKIVNIQKKWKQIGSAGNRFENKLWAEFRASCEKFFNARDTHFAAQDEALVNNLTEKNNLIAAIEAFEVGEDKQAALTELRKFSEQFNAIGHVPMKNKNDIYERFKKALDSKYAALKLEAAEKDMILFRAKLETLAANPDRSKVLSGERNEIRKQIDLLNKEILQLENNLGFFARSKGADALRQEVEKKVEHAKSKINSLKQKLKLIPNE